MCQTEKTKEIEFPIGNSISRNINNVSGRRDSNSESLGPKPSALAVTPRPVKTTFMYRKSNTYL